jgi:hypothetical protein
MPEPFNVLLLEIVGFDEVFQHTPLAVTDAPHSLITSPPVIAVVCVTLELSVVFTTGMVGLVVKVISFPYMVVRLLVA